MKYITLAFQFLTIISVRIKQNVTEKDMARSSIFFPLAGAFQGAVLTIVCIIMNFFFSSTLTAGILVLVYVLTNGGFHIDGLSDTCDALSVKSTGDKDLDIKKRLLAMKDSATGAIGATAITLFILLKYLLLRELFITGRQINPYVILFLLPVFSKWALVQAMGMGKSAKSEGLGSTFMNNINISQMILASGITILMSLLVQILFLLVTSQLINTTSWQHMQWMLLFCVAEMVVLLAISYALIRLFTRKFGGLTGDNLGAIHEASEFVFLITAILWI